jgi:hypothetical protein
VIALLQARYGKVGATAQRMPQPRAAAWSAQQAWSVAEKPLFELRGKSAEELPLYAASFFRLSDGRFVVADGGTWYGGQPRPQNALLVYDSSGAYLTRWGRSGQGPGEFGRLGSWAGVYRGDSIAAFDEQDFALEIFSSNGKFGRRLSLSRNSALTRANFRTAPGLLGVFADGSVLQHGIGLVAEGAEGPAFSQHELYLDSANGGLSAKLGPLAAGQIWRRNTFAEQFIFGLRGLTAVGRNEWYFGTGEDFRIEVRDRNGRNVRELRRSIERVAVTDRDKDAYAAWILTQPTGMFEGPVKDRAAAIRNLARRTRENGRFADRKPAYSAILVDSEQNVWVEHYRYHAPMGDWPKEAARWSVFDPAGKFLGEVRTPVGVDVKSITRDLMLGVWKDDLDVPHAAVYALNKPRGN